VNLEFREHRARRVVNVRRHVDGPWFWNKYSAHPYMGCRSGCEFCYLRGGRYLGRRDPALFDTLIQVKVNAVDLLRRELARLTPEVIACGDWQQPADDRYRLSRGMLEVVLDLGFPLFIVERSPLLVRDLDLLIEIHRKAAVRIVFSLSSLDPTLKRAFEPRSPGIRRHLEAMQTLAAAGIPVGTALMPVIPFLGDSPAHLEAVVQATQDHGGAFVLVGGLTMEGVQAARSLAPASWIDSSMELAWRRLYRSSQGTAPSYAPLRENAISLTRAVRDLCLRHGPRDRIPRPILPGPLAVNKRLAERLFLRTYDLELEGAQEHRIWAYRKAAWAVDEWPESLAEPFQARGEAGMREMPAIGTSLAREIGGCLGEIAQESQGITNEA
jgi:DNA repair photolyase